MHGQKGLIHEREFTPRLVQDIAEKAAGRPKSTAGDVRRVEKRFRDACERRRERNLQKYKPGIGEEPEALPEVAAPELVYCSDNSHPGGVLPIGDREYTLGPDWAEGLDLVPRPEWGGGDHQGQGRQPVVANERELGADPGVDIKPEWPMVHPDRQVERGEQNGRTNRYRAGLAGPDQQNAEGLGREGSMFDQACADIVRESEEFECSIERFGQTINRYGKLTAILDRIVKAIREIGPAIEKWLKSFRKEQEEQPKSEWEKAISLDLKPPWEENG